MNSARIIKKYGLKSIEQNGRTGVVTSRGKLTPGDTAYIKSHKEEILAVINANANKFDPQPPVLTAADIARQRVDELEQKYRIAQRHGVASAINARDAYEEELGEWQKAYPAEARQHITGIRYNVGATNDPWNI